MNNFKKGDIVELINSQGLSAKQGCLAKVLNIDGVYVYVKWIRKTKLDKELIGGQTDGGYEKNRFSNYSNNIKESTFKTKDSGKRQEFTTGMQRDTQDDKARYDLIDIPMLTRWAELMARGAEKYGERNWEKAETEEELTRFKSSAFRHFVQWFEGDVDEDHAAAVLFNIAGAEMVKTKLKKSSK
jgi:hypothetical protein